MLFCINCGQQLPDGAKFCSKCGTRVKTFDESNEQELAGKIVRCPSCGEVIPSFTTVCPACKSEFRSLDSNNSVKMLSIKLEQIENTRDTKQTPSFVSLMMGNDGRISRTDNQKISLIKNFVIPNTYEDICEFIILASSNIDVKLYGWHFYQNSVNLESQREISDAWFSKLEQAYQKASFSFGDTEKFIQIKNIYEEKKQSIKKEKTKLIIAIISLVASILFLIVFLFLFILYMIKINS